MDLFIQQILGGLATGAIYSALALALVMIYQSTHLVNFAQGEMAMFSTFIAWMLTTMGLPFWAAFLITAIGSFIVGVAIERIIIRPMDTSSPLPVVVVLIGLFVVFHALAGVLFGYMIQDFPTPFRALRQFRNPYVGPHEMGMVATILVVSAIIFALLRWTRIGLAMRAAAENPTSSQLCGIPVGWMLALGWGVAAVLGSVAGILAAPVVYLEPNMMSGILIYGFAAALVGGIDNPWGAVAGGILVGIAENLMGTYVVGTELKFTVALVLILGVLLVRPSGLFGRHYVARV
jgi:branched-chain amino acid transport system permease protein